jgi:hypothetical protein
MQTIFQKYASTVSLGSQKTDSLSIPGISNYNNMLNFNYTLAQLKTIAQSHNITQSGTKIVLYNRIFTFLKLTNAVRKIQNIIRLRNLKKTNVLRGPALNKRSLCTNETDFLSDVSIKEIPYIQFFSFKDTDNFIYGFDILSLHHLILKSEETIKNPYNRNIISDKIINALNFLIKTNKKINLKLDDNISQLSPAKKIELKALDIFQQINLLGNYSNPKWFLSLSRIRIIRFIEELIDIWQYRAQITIEEKSNIFPLGNPFAQLGILYIKQEADLLRLQDYILEFIKMFISGGRSKESKTLASYYVLGALTIVNSDAALALPWLYQSFCHS